MHLKSFLKNLLSFCESLRQLKALLFIDLLLTANGDKLKFSNDFVLKLCPTVVEIGGVPILLYSFSKI